MFEQLVKQIATADGITEQHKAENQMEWVAQMNNIRSRATEIVNVDFIFHKEQRRQGVFLLPAGLFQYATHIFQPLQ